MKITILCSFFLLLGFSVIGQAKDWRGIVPLHSTRADVERILGPASGKCRCSYSSGDDNVQVVYSSGNCKKGGSGGWNIRPDTVIRLIVYPKAHPRLDVLGMDLTKFTKKEDPELPGIFYYFDESEGFGMTVEDGVVRDFFYEPAVSDRSLHCPVTRRRTSAWSGLAMSELLW
jgi:hypothetical protein